MEPIAMRLSWWGMTLVTALAVLSATNVVIGWERGYLEPLGYVFFWTLAGLTIATAWVVVSRLFGTASRAAVAARVAVVSFAVVVGCGFLLGLLKQLTVAGFVALQSALFAAAWCVPTASSQPAIARTYPRYPPWVVGTAIALASFAAAFAVERAPLTLYDSVSYHLFFASRWLQDRTLSIVPTPFSDVAQAYAPANGELYFLWLMAPFHGDLLARFGQLPFAALGSVALYLLARRLGAEPHHAVYPALFFPLSRPVLEQAVGANVDLIAAALFLTTLYFGLEAIDSNRVRDWVFFGVNLGLYLGTKYLALVYAPILLLLCARRLSPRILWAAIGVAIFALPWYARNWLVAGSPIYPASLMIGGVTVARGAFTRAAMLNTVFHTDDWRLFPTMAARALGPTLLVPWILAAMVGGVRLARRGWWPHAVVALMPFAMVLLYWFGLPVNVDARFLMPAVGPALVVFAFIFGRSTAWNACMHVGCAAAALWILVGSSLRIPAALPWFMNGWWSLDGLVPAAFIVTFLALALFFAIAYQLTRASRWPAAAALAAVALTAAVLVTGAEAWCGPRGCEYLKTTSPHIRPDLISAWEWVDGNVRDGTIAYTGINLPYPLTGERLTNRVVYVNTDGHPRWRFHDYDRAYRAGWMMPPKSPLATSSGELRPVAAIPPGPRDDAVRPRYDRMAGSKSAWIGNLEVFGVTHVFIAALSAYEVDHVWHNGRDLPIEDEWCASEPEVFHLVYENPQVRVYATNLPLKARA